MKIVNFNILTFHGHLWAFLYEEQNMLPVSMVVPHSSFAYLCSFSRWFCQVCIGWSAWCTLPSSRIWAEKNIMYTNIHGISNLTYQSTKENFIWRYICELLFRRHSQSISLLFLNTITTLYTMQYCSDHLPVVTSLFSHVDLTFICMSFNKKNCLLLQACERRLLKILTSSRRY